MYKRLFFVAIGLWLVTLSVVATLFLRGITTPGSDGRTAISLTTSERDFVLGEMRGMLGAVQGVIEGIAANNASAVAKAASSGGLAIEAGVPVTLMAKLPLDFKHQGMAMHTGFDELAAAATRGESSALLTARLAEHINLCIGCHQSFRFNQTP